MQSYYADADWRRRATTKTRRQNKKGKKGEERRGGRKQSGESGLLGGNQIIGVHSQAMGGHSDNPVRCAMWHSGWKEATPLAERLLLVTKYVQCTRT